MSGGVGSVIGVETISGRADGIDELGKVIGILTIERRDVGDEVREMVGDEGEMGVREWLLSWDGRPPGDERGELGMHGQR